MIHAPRLLVVVSLFFALMLPYSDSSANKVEKKFESTLKSAAHRASKFTSVEADLTDYRGIAGVTYKSAFTWEVIVQGNWEIDSRNVRGIINVSGYFEVDPEGNGFNFAMPIQFVPSYLEKDFFEKKDIKKLWKHIDKDFPKHGMEYSLKKEENTIIFRTRSNDSKSTGSRLQRTMEASRALLSITGRELFVVEKDYMKNLDKTHLESLSVTQLEKLLDLDHDLFVENTEVAGGAWSIGKENSGTILDVENHGDKLVFYLSREFPDDDDARRAKRLDKIAKFVKKNRIKQAHSTEAVLFPGYPTYISTKVIFQLDGSKKGKDLKKCFEELRYKYHHKLGKAFDKS